jgi:hypothetical protein
MGGVQRVLDSARDAAFALEGIADKDAEARLKQIDAIVHSATAEFRALENITAADVDRIAKKYVIQLSSLEKDIISDLTMLVDQTECAVRRAIDVSLRETLGTSILFLANKRLTITPPVMYIGEQSCLIGSINCGPLTKDFVIRDPFEKTYEDIRTYLEARLNSDAREDTPIRSIVSTYTLIADLARRTTCYTIADKDVYLADFMTYNNKARTWKQFFGSNVGRQ